MVVQRLLFFQPEWFVPSWKGQYSRNGMVHVEKELLFCQEIQHGDTSKGFLSFQYTVFVSKTTMCTGEWHMCSRV